MNVKDAFEFGFNRGIDMTKQAIYDLHSDMKIKTIDHENIMEMVLECEENARQCSPFEFFANDINNGEYPDELWEAYDTGLYDGINEALNTIRGF